MAETHEVTFTHNRRAPEPPGGEKSSSQPVRSPDRANKLPSPGPSVWAVIVLVILIWITQWIGKGIVPAGAILAGLAALLIGAIIPAFIAPILVVALIALYFNGEVGTKFFGWLQSLGKAPTLGGVAGAAFGSSFNPQQNIKPQGG